MIKIDNGRSLKDQVNQFIEIHTEVFDKEISTAFGERYLINMYNDILEEEDTMVFYKRDQEKIVGYIIYTKGNPQLYKYIRFNELVNFLIKTLKTPSMILKLAIQGLISFKRKDSNFFEISFFAVSNDFQSKGIGKDLINELLNYSKKIGIKNIITKTNNQNLYKFYINFFKGKLYSAYTFLGITYYLIKIKPQKKHE